jgi:hypothetical protein
LVECSQRRRFERVKKVATKGAKLVNPPQPKQMPVFEREEILALLRHVVHKAGGQSAWSKKIGIERTKSGSQWSPAANGQNN